MKKSRKEILIINQVFTGHLLGVQDVKYCPHEYSDGEEIILEESVKLTKEKADELNEEAINYFNNNKDSSPFKSQVKSKWVGRETLISTKKNYYDYLFDLGKSLEGLRKKLNQKYLLILGDWPTPWLNQDNEFKPVKNALKFLEARIARSFNGGFLLKENELINFIPHLFWLARCNVSLPEFMMTFTDSKCVITICKYGVLHFEFYDYNESIEILDYYNKIDFLKVKQCKDPIEFGNFSDRKMLV